MRRKTTAKANLLLAQAWQAPSALTGGVFAVRAKASAARLGRGE
jgi:hypothetical protein